MRLVLLMVAALAVTGCMRRSGPSYVAIDPATGQQIGAVQATPQAAAANVYAPQAYAQAPAQQAYAQAAPPQQRTARSSSGRGLFGRQGAPGYAARPQPMQSPAVIQYTPPPQPVYPAPQAVYPQPSYPQGYAVAPGGAGAYGAYASAPAYQAQPAYTLDAGDRLRIVVFGQDGITNSYIVDAAGNVSLPLIGTVPARGATTQQLSKVIADKLRHGYVREPHVSVEVEAYRPFFILGEVTNPGQYAYVPNMTAETAIAIAGGFAPRASKKQVELTRNVSGQQFHGKVPLNMPLRPGDTIKVPERWF
ncbi:MAG: polysaccharide biosynthesis/export family protein [Xanthobacteraceae bacterium]|uniref:polysaccharide biosynthesis/export family protein n=1 Tax=Pseudolabrys sp. TaxID=1960880 RepID=UPI003D13D992